jgi:hypothetical protein
MVRGPCAVSTSYVCPVTILKLQISGKYNVTRYSDLQQCIFVPTSTKCGHKCLVILMSPTIMGRGDGWPDRFMWLDKKDEMNYWRLWRRQIASSSLRLVAVLDTTTHTAELDVYGVRACVKC